MPRCNGVDHPCPPLFLLALSTMSQVPSTSPSELTKVNTRSIVDKPFIPMPTPALSSLLSVSRRAKWFEQNARGKGTKDMKSTVTGLFFKACYLHQKRTRTLPAWPSNVWYRICLISAHTRTCSDSSVAERSTAALLTSSGHQFKPGSLLLFASGADPRQAKAQLQLHEPASRVTLPLHGLLLKLLVIEEKQMTCRWFRDAYSAFIKRILQ